MVVFDGRTSAGGRSGQPAYSRILVFIPNWVGDVVMATAALKALRVRFGQARISHLCRPYVATVLEGAALADEQILWPPVEGMARVSGWALAMRLRRERFDLAILLTNSFRSAMTAFIAGASRRVGYARDGRGWMLTDRLHAPRVGGKWVPVPALDYYNSLATHVGCESPGDQLVLATTAADEKAIDGRLGKHDLARPLVVLNPGANFGSAKCWPAEKYAAVSDALVREAGARVVASLGPKEKVIADALRSAAREPLEVFIDPPLGLGPLKALVKRCDLLITNDTGPRHFAAAFSRPVITVFGSSDPAWTETRFADERIVKLNLDCQPCMQRVCPLGHHDCMKKLEPGGVIEAAMSMLKRNRTASLAGTRA
jgi:heptosyltransferase-2